MGRHARLSRPTDLTGTIYGDKPAVRLATEQLWEVSAHLDLVLASLIDHAVLTLDVNGHVTSWNSGAQRTMCYDSGDIIGRHFCCFFTKTEQDADMPMRTLRLARDLGKHEAEGWRVRRDGDRFWANTVVHPLTDHAGNLRGFVQVTRDISQRLQVKKLREELGHAQKHEMVGQLTNGIAHDFNSLLTSIEAGHALLLGCSDDARIARVVDVSRDAVAKSKRLISQLLGFSCKQVLSPQPSNMFNLISSMDALLQRAAGESIRLRWNLAPDLPTILVDQAQFQSALLNLVVNAREAMPNGGWLTIFMDKVMLTAASYAPPYDVQPGEYVVLGVSDTGGGMTPEVQSRAIEPFFTTKLSETGSGLGLSQCFGFARQSGGTLRIESVGGKGTTIRLLLPAADARPAAYLVKRTHTILFVDDDSSIRTLVGEILRAGGHKVIEAEDGRTALACLRTDDTIDYLFTDMVMPNDMNGVQLMAAARAIRPGLPTLLASGYPRESLRDMGQIPDDVMFIAKPYSMADLSAHIRGGHPG